MPNKSPQQVFNTLAGSNFDTEKPIQKVSAENQGIFPKTRDSVQKIIEVASAQNKHTNIHKMFFNNLKDQLSLTGSYTNHSIQKMLNMALDQGVTIETILTGVTADTEYNWIWSDGDNVVWSDSNNATLVSI